MVSPEKLPKKEDVESYVKLAKHKSSRSKKRKPSSVLQSRKIYLHFKNLALLSKWEATIKNFGAQIVQYLDKEVHYVVTDLPGYNGKPTSLADPTNIISPQCYSLSPAMSISGDDQSAARITRTRSEAMLEKVSVRTQGVSSISNPITVALSWKIPVYSIDCFQTLLDQKISQHIQLRCKCDETKADESVRVFGKHFLKLEHVVEGKYRPEFKEVSKWPKIVANTELGSCPFDTSKSSKRAAARKDRKHGEKRNSERMNRAFSKTENEYGYCEICAVHYDDLSQHVTTSTHMKFVCDDKHYVELDNCIKTRSVEAFLVSHNSNENSRMKELNAEEDMGRNLRKNVSLHLNSNSNNNNNENSAVTRSLTNAKLMADESLKQPLQVQCNGFTNYHLRKSATNTKSDSVLLKSPTVYSNHNKDLLRETRKLCVSCPDASKMQYKDLAAQLSPSPLDDVDGPHRLRSRKSLVLPAILLGTTAEDNKNRALLSPVSATNSNHFLRSKLSPKWYGRSKTSTTVEENGVKKSTTATPANNRHAPSSLGQHYTRSANKTNCVVSPASENDRRTLRPPSSPRDDAVARMNGKPTSCRRKGSLTSTTTTTTTTTTLDDEETSRNIVPNPSPSYQGNKNSNVPAVDSAAEHNCHGRKRLSVEEKFLEDNREYYKYEVFQSKLRSTEFYCNKEGPDPQSARPPETKETTDSNSGSKRTAPECCDGKKPVYKRQSALRLLNLEATNFMFGPPKREDESSSTDSEEHEYEGSNKDGDEKFTSKEATTAASAKEKASTSSPAAANRRGHVKKRKRRTHAEVFIHDNLDYYKFEISGSRLRQHKNSDSDSVTSKISPCSSAATTTTTTTTSASARIPSQAVKVEEVDETTPVVIRKRGGRGRKKILQQPASPPPPPLVVETPPDSDLTQQQPQPDDTVVKEEPAADGSVDYYDRPAPPSDSIRFAFESVPSNEPWFRAFQRFDRCEEQCIPIPNTTYFSRYRDVVPFPRRLADRKGGATSAAAALATAPSPKDSGGNSLAHFRRKRKSRLSRFIIDDKPRKSPRCHASTLAILSSITGNRRRSRKLLASRGAASHKPAGRPTLNRSDLEANNKSLTAQLGEDYRRKAAESAQTLAKNIDRHFIEVFGDDDCEDAYLKRLLEQGELKTANDEVEGWPSGCCLQFDDEILHDHELLRSLSGGWQLDDMFEDMSRFFEGARSCTNMEESQRAEDELHHSMGARSAHDTLVRLMGRENDLSCNSSDCGASSTCEFLGFAEDGRTVSRKRKRKRPNMTGWPHDRNKQRSRLLRVGRGAAAGVGGRRRKTNNNLKNGGSGEDKKPGLNGETVSSEAESECTDDETAAANETSTTTTTMVRKRRRTNNSLSAASDALEMKKNESQATTKNGEREPPTSTSSPPRRPSKVSPRKGTPVTRRKSSSMASAIARRNRFN